MNYIEEKLFRVSQSKTPLILFLGKESFFKEEVLKKIKESAKDTSFNWKIVNGEELDIHEISTFISSYSFFSSKKFLIIKNGEKVLLPKLREIKNLFNGIQDSLKVIVTIEGKNEEKWKEVSPHITRINFPSLKDWEIRNWVIEKLKEEGKEITQQALNLLVEMNRENMYSLNSEIEKLLSYSFEKRRISLKEIEKVCSEGKKVSLYQLILFLLLKDIRKAMIEWERLRLSGVSPFSFIGLFTWELRRIGSFKEEIEERKNFFTLFRKYNIWNKRLQIAYQSVIRRWSWEKIEKIYASLQELDIKLKNGYPVSPTLEIFFYRLVKL